MSKLYMVTTGEYEDYSVFGIYDTEDKANLVAGMLQDNEDNVSIEPVELNRLYQEFLDGHNHYIVTIKKDGTVKDVKISRSKYQIYKDSFGQRGNKEVFGNVFSTRDGAIEKTDNYRKGLLTDNKWISRPELEKKRYEVRIAFNHDGSVEYTIEGTDKKLGYDIQSVWYGQVLTNVCMATNEYRARRKTEKLRINLFNQQEEQND